MVKRIMIEWKAVAGYENYEVSNDGRVRSVDRIKKVNDNGRIYYKPLKGKELSSASRKGRSCYNVVSLTKNGVSKSFYVHRLVAEAFIPNPLNLPQVNHKDENKINNKSENLEWCTNDYNHSYGTGIQRQADKIRGIKHTEEHNKKISESLKRYYMFCSYGERKEECQEY